MFINCVNYITTTTTKVQHSEQQQLITPLETLDVPKDFFNGVV